MEEQVFLQEPGVLVTSTRIDIHGQTFAVRNVGSVKVQDEGRPWLAFLFLLIGIGAMSGQSYIFGACCLVIGGAWLWKSLRTRKLVFIAGGGETVALKSTDPAQVERLRAAVAQAISVR